MYGLEERRKRIPFLAPQRIPPPQNRTLFLSIQLCPAWGEGGIYPSHGTYCAVCMTTILGIREGIEIIVSDTRWEILER